MGPVLLFALTVLSASPSPTHSETAPAWTFRGRGDIRWWWVAPSGEMVVGTDREITVVSADSGTTIWTLSGLDKPMAGDVQILSPTSLALFSLRGKVPAGQARTFLMDVRDGRVWWSADTLGISEFLGGFLLPSSGQLMMGVGLAPKGKDRALIALDVKTGAIAWKSEDFFANYKPQVFDIGERPTIALHQPPLLDTDSTAILFMNRNTMWRVDLRSGERLWEARNDYVLQDVRDSSAPWFGFANMTLAADGQRFFAPIQNSLGCFSLRDGHGLWSKPPWLPGIVTQIAEVPAGILVRTVDHTMDPAYKLLLLDAGTGEIRWTLPRSKVIKLPWLAMSNVLVEKDRALVAAGGKLLAVDWNRGEATPIADLKFHEVDAPDRLEANKAGYLVSGAQNLVLFSPDGSEVLRFYRKAPGTGLSGLGLLAGATMLAFMNPHELGAAPAVVLPEVLKTYSATSSATDYVFILTDKVGDRKKTGLVRVNKSNGEVAGEIPLGTSEPEYHMDWNGSVYFKADAKTIRCFRF